MGDMAEGFRDLTAARKQRHIDWHVVNMGLLHESGFKFSLTNGGEAVLFREWGRPKVDFYPSTGRWRISGSGVTYSGGAQAFLVWYRKQWV